MVGKRGSWGGLAAWRLGDWAIGRLGGWAVGRLGGWAVGRLRQFGGLAVWRFSFRLPSPERIFSV